MDFKIIQELVNHNVPRYIQYFHNCGGVDEDEWKWLNYGFGSEFDFGFPECKLYDEESQKQLENPNHPYGLLARADELLLFTKDYNTFRNSLFVLVKAIAIMSFIPGGVKFGNARFSSEVENYIDFKIA